MCFKGTTSNNFMQEKQSKIIMNFYACLKSMSFDDDFKALFYLALLYIAFLPTLPRDLIFYSKKLPSNRSRLPSVKTRYRDRLCAPTCAFNIQGQGIIAILFHVSFF